MAKKLSSKPDPALVKDQLMLLQSMRKDWGTEKFSTYMIWIQGKKEDARIKSQIKTRVIPFAWNPAQRDIYPKLAEHNIILKGRQMGFTTYVLLIRLMLEALLTPGTNSLLISQNGEYVDKHFMILKRAFKFFGAIDPVVPENNTLSASLHQNLLHTAYSNRKELIFDQLDNRINIASAENEETGQGLTLARVACSEVARWPGNPEETLANLKESIVLGGTIDLESTADGAGGYFFEEYQRSYKEGSDFRAHFYAWWWDPGYRLDLTPEQYAELDSDLSEDERKLRNKFHLELEQIAFRRQKQKSLRHNFDEKYAEDDVTAFLVSGTIFFDKEILRARMIELMNFKPYTSFSGGSTVILKKKIPGRKYVIGADPASGRRVGSNLDSSAAKVIDLDTGEEVGAFLDQLPPEDFAFALIDLGHYFNDALIAVERSTGQEAGGDGGTILMTLLNQNYPNVYHHRAMIRKRGSAKKEIIVEPGFPTTGGTRPIILNKLASLILNFPELINDIILVKQAMMFTRDERGRPAATEGAHDDMVLASALAQGARLVEIGLWDPLVNRSQKYGATAIGEQVEEDEPS